VPNPSPQRLGLLGGTFDPPHRGHLAAALAVRDALGLDRVDFLVANDPWQKSGDRDVTSAAIRLQMVRALTDDVDGIGVDDREVRRGGPTYTVETLEELAIECPGTDVFMIVGQDTADRIHTWHRHEDLLALSTLVIVNREQNAQHVPAALADARVQFVSMPLIDVSSTSVRAAAGSGDDVSGMTSAGVADIVRANGLYGAKA
jgi:nicotinate-nucleotide adenylyltransferase